MNAPTRGRRLRFRFGDNLALKALSLVLAVLGWMLAHGEQTSQETVVVPVDYVYPTALVLVNNSPLPERVVIQIAGSQAALQAVKSQLREGSIQYLVDLEDAELGRTVHSFRRPPLGMSSLVVMQTVSPAEVEFQFDALSSRTLPVQLRILGDLPAGYVESERSIEPSFVTLMGARSELADLHAVPTVPLRFSERRQSVNQTIALDLSGMHMHPDSATSVKVALRISEVTGDVHIQQVPVVFGDGARFKMEPSRCTVSLFGPLPVLAELGPDSLRAEVVGQLDGERVGKLGAADLRWNPLAGDDGKPGVLIKVAHPRASEVVVKQVDPPFFQVTAVLAPALPETTRGSE